MIGQRISHYQVLEKLGAGGMGEVFLAEDTRLKRRVALKFLPKAMTADPEARARFEQEAQAAAGLHHPNIVTIFEINEHEGQTFIAMEYVEGQTLKDRMADVSVGTGRDLSLQKQTIPISDAISIAIQVASGLAAAHEKGIVHRDIKPQNILVDRNGNVKILDFGLAKLKGVSSLTKESSTLGTVAYMSPEQALGKEVDQRTDIWSLGVVLYEMLTGKLPFPGEYEQAMIYSILNEEPAPLPPLHPRLATLVKKTLVKNPASRCASASQLLADLHTASFDAEKGGRRQPYWQKWLLIPLACGLAGLVLLAVLLLKPAAKKESPAGITSIAVLPLQNFSNDPEQEYFADGMTEALITELSRIKALRVISRTSAMLYKKSAKPLPEIAKELRVEAILEGSALRAGDRIRITAQLIEAKSDKHLWAEEFERDYRDILTLQKEVSQAIAREIMITVTPEEKAGMAAARRVDPEAHDGYLKGLFLINKFGEAETWKGISFFEKAIRKDPNYALPYTGLAEAYDNLLTMGFISPRVGLQKMEECTLKALNLDNTLGEAHLMLADVKLIKDWDWPGAEREYKLALQLSPSYSTTYMWYGNFLMCMGRNDEAQVMIKRAREIDPMSLALSTFSAMCSAYARQYDDAITQLQEIIAIEPNPMACSFLGYIYLQKKMMKEAIAVFEKGIACGGGSMSEVELACAQAHAGKPANARNMLADLLKQSARRYVSTDKFVKLYWALGDTDSAIAWLEKGADERSSYIFGISRNPVFDDFRSHPRFVALVKKVGLE